MFEKKTILPKGFEKYFHEGTLEEAAAKDFDTDYIGNEDLIEEYKLQGYEYVGFIIGNDKYYDSLDALNLLNVVKDNGDLFAVVLSAGRIMTVDPAEIKSMVGEA